MVCSLVVTHVPLRRIVQGSIISSLEPQRNPDYGVEPICLRSIGWFVRAFEMSNGPIVISDKLDSWCVGPGPIIVICGPANQKTPFRGNRGALLTALFKAGGCA